MIIDIDKINIMIMIIHMIKITNNNMINYKKKEYNHLINLHNKYYKEH
jgi:hypothetical protein